MYMWLCNVQSVILCIVVIVTERPFVFFSIQSCELLWYWHPQSWSHRFITPIELGVQCLPKSPADLKAQGLASSLKMTYVFCTSHDLRISQKKRENGSRGSLKQTQSLVCVVPIFFVDSTYYNRRTLTASLDFVDKKDLIFHITILVL
eukprot:c20613_g1_i1.p1 GENE.c20613_g1_i1~~c20613_g1_i1.p1  ORF type:complete len:148 (+),score=12.77 c20613_g1_i1:172-615(+)